MADYKEGVDFEIRIVKTKDGKTAYKNRHFFTKAEKEAMKAPKKSEEKPSKSATKPKEKATTKDAMSGYRKGDVTTSPLSSSKRGRGDGGAEVVRRTADRALSKAATNKKPNNLAATIGSALGKAIGSHQKPVVAVAPSSVNPISKAAGKVGAAVGSALAKANARVAKSFDADPKKVTTKNPRGYGGYAKGGVVKRGK